MKKVLVIAAVTALAAAAWAAPSSSGVLEDNLAPTGPRIRNCVPGDKWRDSWVAIDYTPSTAVAVTAFRHHYIYNEVPLKNQLNFQLIRGQNPGVGSLVATWSVAAAKWTEFDTGWFAFGRKVYLCIVPFNPPRELSPSARYWFAYQTENDQPANIIYWAFWASIKGELLWYKSSGTEPWRSIRELWGLADGSYRLDGSFTGVAPASLGRVKALFK
jgi:hypothetical protein